MIALEPPFRLATPEDAGVLAGLVDIAGDGLPSHLWRRMAEPGEDPWEIGRRRQAAKARAGGAVVVDEGEGPVALLMGHALPPEPEPIDPDTPAPVRPLEELERLAPATWYINVLAVLPEHRGRGLGGRLLALAERIAADEALTGLSLIVPDHNLLARRLYERHGYEELARRDIVRDGWETRGEEWILMVRGAGTIPDAEG